MAVAALLFLALITTALRSSEEQTGARKTGRTSLKDNKLMQRAGASDAVQELHPETTFIDDFQVARASSKAFTWKRMGAFTFAIFLGLAVALFADTHLFAIKRNVSGLASAEACRTVCRASPQGLCDDAHLSFQKKFCTTTGERCSNSANGSQPMSRASCSFSEIPEAWKVDFVLISAVMGIYLIVEGVSAELILFGLSCIYGFLGIITGEEAWAGIASGSVIGLALLFPIASAIEETGVLDTAIGMMLGSPQSFYVAFFRMLVPVAFLSAFLSNTAIVTMMIPLIVSWSRTLGVHPGKLLMPLSFAAQLGGSCTLIGSSHCLVARDSVDKSLYTLTFFDLSYAGTILSLATFGVMALCLPFLSSSASPVPSVSADDADAVQVEKENLYTISFFIRPGGGYVGMDPELASLQLKRLPGVKDIQASGEFSGQLEENACLSCIVEDEGVVSLRQMRGLRMTNEAQLRALGMEREKRHLYEAILSSNSRIAGAPFEFDAMRHAMGCCPIAIKGKEGMPQAGDILLLEADERYVGGTLWEEEFSITKMVPNSSPRRIGGVHDRVRCILVCSGMAVLIVSVTFELVSLSIGAGMFVLFLVLSNAYTMDSVYKTIKVPVLLTIAGAGGLSLALQATGIAKFAATKMTQIAIPLGTLGVRTAVYLLATFLSLFMNNSATVAIIGPMLATIADSTCAVGDTQCQENSVKALTHVMVFAAGTCLMSPLGYQTNLMVMQDGGYTFGDFTKYGSLIQAFHMVACVGVVFLFVDILNL
ncbi:SAC1 [Symbiodinium natans]|uniref:SAC1 protein n=1 Tax=Symbiodinium natans TaxID=878477 RepID=A0A812THT5_9DINO|nr:SAC1 [Symbiodinium natans]